MLKSLMKVAAAAALLVAGPALAQIQTIDPDQADSYEAVPETMPEEAPYAAPQDSGTGADWAPVDTQPVEAAPVDSYGQPAWGDGSGRSNAGDSGSDRPAGR